MSVTNASWPTWFCLLHELAVMIMTEVLTREGRSDLHTDYLGASGCLPSNRLQPHRIQCTTCSLPLQQVRPSRLEASTAANLGRQDLAIVYIHAPTCQVGNNNTSTADPVQFQTLSHNYVTTSFATSQPERHPVCPTVVRT